MAFEYLKQNGRLNGTSEKRTQNSLNRFVNPIQRKLLSKVLGFLEKI